MSPEGVKQFRHLSSRKRAPRRDKGKARAAQADATGRAAGFEADKGDPYCNTRAFSKVARGMRTYRLNVTLTYGPQHRTVVTMPEQAVQADQGSEVNIISEAFIRKRDIPTIDLGVIRFKGLHIVNADGLRVPLKEFISATVMCQGVARKIWAVVRPAAPTDIDTVMLLRLPWLHEVDAVLNIKDSSLMIGTNIDYKTRVSLQGPQITITPRQKLMLSPGEDEVNHPFDRYPSWSDSESMNSSLETESNSSGLDEDSNSEDQGN